MVESEIANLTPDPSFGHNLCFGCSNEQYEPILDIYVLRAFQWYKERHNSLSFDPWNCSLKFQESTGTRSPKVGVALGVWRFTPSHFPTLPGIFDVTPGLSLGPHPYNPFALVVSPKLGLRHSNFTLTNLLFDLCKSAWIIDPLVARPSLIPKLQHTPLPPKCYKLRSVPQLLFPLSSPFDSQLSPSKSLGVCHLS